MRSQFIVVFILVLILLSGCVNNVPVAVIEAPSQVPVGSMVFIKASGYDPGEQECLAGEWSILAKPEGSNAQIEHFIGLEYNFYADLEGVYIVSFVLNDGKVKSKQAIACIQAVTTPVGSDFPVACISVEPWEDCPIGEPVILHAGSSTVKEGVTPQYTWEMILKPETSQSALQSIHDVESSFTPDIPGLYQVALTVSDGVKSNRISVKITAGSHISNVFPERTDRVDTLCLTWKSNSDTLGTIEYGLDTSYGSSSATADTWGKDHSVRLDHLLPHQLYYFRLTVQDRSGFQMIRTDTFFTPMEGLDLPGMSTSQCYIPELNRLYCVIRKTQLISVNLATHQIEDTYFWDEEADQLTSAMDRGMLYSVDTDGSVREIRISDYQINRVFTTSLPPSESLQHKIYYQSPNRLYVLNGNSQSGPGLVRINLDTGQQEEWFSPFNGLGGIVFSADGDQMFTWNQSYSDPIIIRKYRIWHDEIELVKEQNLERLPYPQVHNSPLIYIEEANQIAYQGILLNATDLTQIYTIFPEPVYILSQNHRYLIGRNYVYDRLTFKQICMTPKENNSYPLLIDNNGIFYSIGDYYGRLAYIDLNQYLERWVAK